MATSNAAPPMASGFFKERRFPSTGDSSGATASPGKITRSPAISGCRTSAFATGAGCLGAMPMDSREGPGFAAGMLIDSRGGPGMSAAAAAPACAGAGAAAGAAVAAS